MEQFSRSTRELISKLLSLSSSADTSAWGNGYVAGVLTLALLLLCCMLLWLIFSYHKALKGVVIPAPNGSIFISARSISDLVKSLDADFNGIVIRKVTLVERKKFLHIELSLVYQLTPSTENAQKLIEELQSRVLTTLETVFGIKNIAKVNVAMARSKPVKTTF